MLVEALETNEPRALRSARRSVGKATGFRRAAIVQLPALVTHALPSLSCGYTEPMAMTECKQEDPVTRQPRHIDDAPQDMMHAGVRSLKALSVLITPACTAM